MTEAVNKRKKSTSLAISVSDLKAIYLFGVDLTDDNGNPMPDQLFEFYIKSAMRWLEEEIPGLVLVEDTFEEWHDYHLNDYQSYSFLRVKRFPLQSVEKVGFQFPLQNAINDFNPTWFRADSPSGQINLLPTAGTFSSILLSQGGSYLPLLYSGTQYVPHLFRVEYKAGFKPDELPENIINLIGLKAAMGPLNIAGDLIAGAGIASKSLSLDGLSQSVSTTSSATNAGYGARIIQYEKQIKEELKQAKSFYAPINMVVM